MGRWGDGMGRCSHLLPMSMVTARQWWTCFSAVRRFAGGKLTSLVQWSVFSLSLDVRTGSVHSSPGQYLSAVSQDREVQMLPHIHKMISSNLPPSYHTTIHSLGLIVPSSVRIVTKTPDRVDSPASQRTQRLIFVA